MNTQNKKITKEIKKAKGEEKKELEQRKNKLNSLIKDS